MKLSIVIPAYNEEAYIGKCLDSIIASIAKTAYEIEIIVIDNASTDKTAEVIKRYPTVKIFNAPARGTNHARQVGFERSSGDIIANVDADNMVSPVWLKHIFDTFSGNPKIVALSGPYIYYDLSRFQQILVKIYYWLAYPAYVISNRVFKHGGSAMGGNFVIKRASLEQIGGYNTDLTFYADDSDTAMRLSKIGIVKFNYKFTIASSARRLHEEGMHHALFVYFINHIWLSVFGRPFTRKDPQFHR